MSRSPAVFFQKYGKPVLPFMNVWYFLLKNISKSSPKVGNRASVGFDFSRGITRKENSHFI